MKRGSPFINPPYVGPFTRYLFAIAMVAGTTVLCEQARPYLSPVNMVMPYLLAVVLAAVFLGRLPAIITALLGVVAFDFFFVPPRFSLTIHDKEYLVTFVTLFTVGVVISTLVAKVRESLETLRVREQQTSSLYNLSRDLAAAVDTTAVLSAVLRHIEQSLDAQVVILTPADGELFAAAATDAVELNSDEKEIATWSFRSRRLAGRGTGSYPESPWRFLPLKALADVLGVLCISIDESRHPEGRQLHRFVNSFATQTSMALERIRLIGEAQQAQLLMARENLERALLNSISHDLRTPLAAITGVLSTLVEEEDKLSAPNRADLLETARDQAERLNRFVANLLDMTRLEAGALQPRPEPCDIQDLIGCALAAAEPRLSGREVSVSLEPDLPLVSLDLVLMIQVMVNLLENAGKHTPEGSPIELAARTEGDRLVIEVSDRGPGVPEHDLGKIFDKFYRTPVPEGAGGTGLGLSICKGIVEAHGGSIAAENRKEGGLKVIVTLHRDWPAGGREPS
ncbi:DUF4118 domain-containing protein [Geomonas sp. Red32]|uniref:DUF4118 domain-containing protein n=1 Tax=Geomonas sp. Red32 TaxID=2912856 RepID=UPI00202CB27B|nr:DUF4118 domain-containing protein [Geomonas sp. Red32]MCM0082850.1 DUF4118 domain-containing protein [Geomonas sp. Red32]